MKWFMLVIISTIPLAGTIGIADSEIYLSGVIFIVVSVLVLAIAGNGMFAWDPHGKLGKLIFWHQMSLVALLFLVTQLCGDKSPVESSPIIRLAIFLTASFWIISVNSQLIGRIKARERYQRMTIEELGQQPNQTPATEDGIS